MHSVLQLKGEEERSTGLALHRITLASHRTHSDACMAAVCCHESVQRQSVPAACALTSARSTMQGSSSPSPYWMAVSSPRVLSEEDVVISPMACRQMKTSRSMTGAGQDAELADGLCMCCIWVCIEVAMLKWVQSEAGERGVLNFAVRLAIRLGFRV